MRTAICLLLLVALLSCQGMPNVPGIPGPIRRSVIFQVLGPLKPYYGYGPYKQGSYNPLLRITK